MNQRVRTDTMKQWTLKDVGRANLEFVSTAIPAPAEHEILVKVIAVSLNYRDLLLPAGSTVPASAQRVSRTTARWAAPCRACCRNISCLIRIGR
jgi:hypothetical protein